jgi:hypothetical protein
VYSNANFDRMIPWLANGVRKIRPYFPNSHQINSDPGVHFGGPRGHA